MTKSRGELCEIDKNKNQTIVETQVNVGCSSLLKIDGGMFEIVDEETGGGGGRGGEATVVAVCK